MVSGISWTLIYTFLRDFILKFIKKNCSHKVFRGYLDWFSGSYCPEVPGHNLKPLIVYTSYINLSSI